MKGFFSENFGGFLFTKAGGRMLGFLFVTAMIIMSCHSNDTDTKSEKQSSPDSNNVSHQAVITPSPDMPSFVVFKDWKIDDPANLTSVLAIYRNWDNANTDSMAMFFGDSAFYDFPNGTRQITTKKTVEATFKKWRHEYTATSNVPFSLISLYNKDLDQQWVIAWTWNKWQYSDGKKDSALYCDNWRIRNGKIEYLNSLENKASKALAGRLNANIPK